MFGAPADDRYVAYTRSPMAKKEMLSEADFITSQNGCLCIAYAQFIIEAQLLFWERHKNKHWTHNAVEMLRKMHVDLLELCTEAFRAEVPIDAVPDI